MSQTNLLRPLEALGSLGDLPLRRFSVKEYHRMGETGVIGEDERVELIDGRIVRMTPIGSKHSSYVSFLNRQINKQLLSIEKTAIVRIQDPVILGDETEPQPDVVLVKFKPNAYADSHPRPEDVLLIIEVAESSLEEDRLIKLPRYAGSGIPEVWIFNLAENIVEVYQEPLTLSNGIPGYRKRVDYKIGEILSLEALPDLRVEIPEPGALLK